MTLAFGDVHYAYPALSAPALSGASVRFAAGESVALVGRNGSGKSTLMLLANGILRPGRGTVTLDGQAVRYDRRGLLDLRSQVGVVFQNPEEQLFSASVYQDVSLGPLNLGLSPVEARERVLHAAGRCDLLNLLDRPTQALSGGEKARAALAGVLAMRPRFLFADELTNSLDPWMRAQVLEIFNDLVADGCTVVLATHDLALAESWATRAVWLDRGQVRSDGPTRDVLTRMAAPSPAGRRLTTYSPVGHTTDPLEVSR